MDWLTTLNEAFQTLLPVVLLALSTTIIYYTGVLVKSGKEKSKCALVDKYLSMLEVTITNAVLATTQTYVDAMKKQNAFDKEAQKKAFSMTYEAVMKVLTDEAKLYLESAVGDLNTYITNQIEATVKLTKE